MHLIVVSQYFWPENFKINDIVSEMVKKGHEVTVLTGLPNYPNGKIYSEYKHNPKQFSNYMGAKIIRSPIISRGSGRLSLLLNYITFFISASVVGVQKLRKIDFDVIFVYEPSPITVALPAIVLKSFFNKPIALWVLDLWPDTLSAVNITKSKAILSAVGKLVGFIYKRCDLILTQSESFIPRINEYVGNESNIRYFPSWSESLLNHSCHDMAPEVPLKDNSFNIMFTGNIGEAQDFSSILSAAELLKYDKRIRWLIVGSGRMYSWVNSEIERRDLQDCVLMFGQYPLDRMPSFFQHADALLVSLKDDPVFSATIPGKVQTYLASGIPILAMLNGEGARIISESGCGIVCKAGDYECLSNVVHKLSVTTKEDRIKMGENGIKLSKTEFDRDKLMNRLEGWMTELTTKSKNR